MTSQQLRDIFNVSFLTGQFPSVPKIAKVKPIHKKQSKVDYVNYRPIPFCLMMKILLKNSCKKDYLIFWISTISYTLYNLVFNKNTQILIL